jgi:hypothetical protein
MAAQALPVLMASASEVASTLIEPSMEPPGHFDTKGAQFHPQCELAVDVFRQAPRARENEGMHFTSARNSKGPGDFF